MMQNAVNESFWDAHGVEIGPCAIFNDFPEFQKKSGIPENYLELDALGGAFGVVCGAECVVLRGCERSVLVLEGVRHPLLK